MIIFNGIQTPDGTLIVSRHRHDYVTHMDKNGKLYMIDGGPFYVRRSAVGDEKVITITTEDDHAIAREYVEWGTYGESGNQTLHYVKIKDMTDGHIKACLENMHHMNDGIRVCMNRELEFRGIT